MQRIDTHEDEPERQKDEGDIIGKMMNMIGSLRDELAKVWTKNSVLEEQLSKLRPKEDAVCDSSSLKQEQPVLRDDESNRKEALEPTPHEVNGREAVESVDDTRTEVKCLHCDANAEPDKSCCDKPACTECDAFGKFAKGEKLD